MAEPRWVKLARQFIGLHEIKGDQHNPEILQMWKDIKRGGIKNDETPWCAAFTGAMLERSGVTSSRFESAKSYLEWGVPLRIPVPGCVVVFERQGGGHVGFAVALDHGNNILVLGGNQGDEVNVRAFPLDRVVGYRWPVDEPMADMSLPIALADMSRGES